MIITLISLALWLATTQHAQAAHPNQPAESLLVTPDELRDLVNNETNWHTWRNAAPIINVTFKTDSAKSTSAQITQILKSHNLEPIFQLQRDGGKTSLAVSIEAESGFKTERYKPMSQELLAVLPNSKPAVVTIQFYQIKISTTSGTNATGHYEILHDLTITAERPSHYSPLSHTENKP